jgi:Undecaprenyl-phosphate glucose phosphotransferase
MADIACFIAAAALVWRHGYDNDLLRRHAHLSIVVGDMAGVLGLAVSGYAITALRSRRWHARVVAGALCGGLLAAAACVFVLQDGDPFANGWLWAWFVAAAILLAGWRAVLSTLVGVLHRAGSFSRRILIVGSPELGRQVAARAAAAGADWNVRGIYDDKDLLSSDTAQRVADGVVEPIALCRKDRIDAVVIALRPTEGDRIAMLRRRFAVTVADVYWSAEFPGLGGDAAAVVGLPSGPALLLQRRPLTEWECLQKRVFDIVLALLLIVMLFPLMAFVTLAVKLTSRGPVLFRQPRIGFNNQMLEILKFRTMYVHCTDLLADEQTKRNDRRVTSIGRWLRRLSLDELPQLFNVLGGSMSMVGPRPHAPNTKAGGRLFADLIAQYALRHRVKPGITGWAQVNGWRGETETVEQIENRVMFDLHYIENWSMLLDIKIVLMTAMGGFLSPRAY